MQRLGALPVYMGLQFVSIYGFGTTTSLNSIVVTPNQFKFGTIYQIGNNSQIWHVGDRAMFKESDVTCRLAYRGVPYTIVEEAKLVLSEYYL